MIALQKDARKDFRILNLTDIQISETEVFTHGDGLELFYKTVAELVEKVEPQLITISGDLSYGELDSFRAIYGCIADYIDSFGVSWSVVWGNHDNQGGAARICEIVAILEKYPHFVYESGDSSLGNGNFVIAINEADTTVAAVMMMDTHDREPFVDGSGNSCNAWARLSRKQLEWYEKQVKLLCCPSVLITHIPIFAYRQAFSAAFNSNLDPKSISFEDSCQPQCWLDGYKDSFGVKYEDICSYPADEGAYELIKKLGSTKLVLCGHDHINCQSINYGGVRLMYALKTGSGCYWDRRLNGGTEILIDGNGDISARHIFCK